jgi:hypothetical protein
MVDYSIDTIETQSSLMAEFDPIFVGTFEKLRPYLIRGLLYLISGCMYIGIFYLILLTIGGLINET